MANVRLKPLIIILLLLLILLQYKLWFEPGGIINILHLNQQVAVQQTQNSSLQQRNNHLIAQVEKMQKGNQLIESRARHDLGMVKKNETFYQIVQLKEKKHQHTHL